MKFPNAAGVLSFTTSHKLLTNETLMLKGNFDLVNEKVVKFLENLLEPIGRSIRRANFSILTKTNFVHA